VHLVGPTILVLHHVHTLTALSVNNAFTFSYNILLHAVLFVTKLYFSIEFGRDCIYQIPCRHKNERAHG
jgi:hypothetical protein